jgi:hypothetical protein
MSKTGDPGESPSKCGRCTTHIAAQPPGDPRNRAGGLLERRRRTLITAIDIEARQVAFMGQWRDGLSMES